MSAHRKSTQFYIVGSLARREVWGWGVVLWAATTELWVVASGRAVTQGLTHWPLESQKQACKRGLVPGSLVQLDVLYMGACGKWGQQLPWCQ